MPIVLEFNKHPAVEGEPRVVAAAYDYKGTATVSWQSSSHTALRTPHFHLPQRITRHTPDETRTGHNAPGTTLQQPPHHHTIARHAT